MIPRLPGLPLDHAPAHVLVADEDARVVELLTFALTAHHFRVTTAADGVPSNATLPVLRERKS